MTGAVLGTGGLMLGIYTIVGAAQALLVAGAFGFMFLSALYMRQVLGYDAARVGLAILPAALVIGDVSRGLSARLNARFGARTVLLPGLALTAGGLLLLARVPVGGADRRLPARVHGGGRLRRRRRRGRRRCAAPRGPGGRRCARLVVAQTGPAGRDRARAALVAWAAPIDALAAEVAVRA